jgi:hypothetical protein
VDLSLQLSIFSVIVYRYVDVSTVDDETAKAISDAVRKTGAEFLEVISY